MKSGMLYTKHRPYILQITVFALFAVLVFNSCKKQNTDYVYDYRPYTEATASSNMRLINMSTNSQLLANGDKLTNFFIAPDRLGYIPPEETTPPATRYFPRNGALGLTWNVPQELLLPNGTVNFKVTSVSNLPAPTDVTFTAKEDYNSPKDYYLLLSDSRVQQDHPMVEVRRSITAPSRPGHFKIRIVNFAARVINSASPMENLVSPMSLAYADGTAVSTVTSNVAPGSWSDYVEVPYGTYQFKVLTADGRQVPSSEQGRTLFTELIYPSTSTVAVGIANAIHDSGITYAPVHTFQPGGIYTIAIHPKQVAVSNGIDAVKELQNSFYMIPDITEPQNLTYTRVQLANALPGSNLALKANGTGASQVTATGNASAYLNLIAGSHELVVQDVAGKTVASNTGQLLTGGNYTLWVYPDKDNKIQTVLLSNNLSGSWFTGKENQGGNAAMDRGQSSFPFNYRFLNLCPDIPYLTFTDGGGVPFSGFNTASGSNLQPGLPLMDNPYAQVNFQFPWTGGQSADILKTPYKFLAYASAPGRVPGDWLKDIPALSSQATIARAELYTQVNRNLPTHEPGIYTIAVIGRYGHTGTNNAQIMIVKHTK